MSVARPTAARAANATAAPGPPTSRLHAVLAAGLQQQGVVDVVDTGVDTGVLQKLEGLAVKPRSDTFGTGNESLAALARVLAAENQPTAPVVVIATGAVSASERAAALAAVKQNGRALRYASAELQSDKEFVLAAVKEYDRALAYASPELRGDKEIVLAALKHSGLAFLYASDELRGDKEFVLAAVKENEFALGYASAELQSDKEFVLAAVKQNGRALQYASDELRGDMDVVIAAVKRTGDVLRSLEPKFERNPPLRLVASATSAHYALVVLKNMKEDLGSYNESRLRRYATWFRRTAFGKYLFGAEDAEINAYRSYGDAASRLAAYWATPTQRKLMLSLDEIELYEEIQRASEEVLQITEDPARVLFREDYKRAFEDDAKEADDALRKSARGAAALAAVGAARWDHALLDDVCITAAGPVAPVVPPMVVPSGPTPVPLPNGRGGVVPARGGGVPDVPDGPGLLRLAGIDDDGSRYFGLTDLRGGSYEGYMSDGVPDGFGVLKSSSGGFDRVYEGGWAEGKRSGVGTAQRTSEARITFTDNDDSTLGYYLYQLTGDRRALSKEVSMVGQTSLELDGVFKDDAFEAGTIVGRASVKTSRGGPAFTGTGVSDGMLDFNSVVSLDATVSLTSSGQHRVEGTQTASSAFSVLGVGGTKQPQTQFYVSFQGVATVESLDAVGIGRAMPDTPLYGVNNAEFTQRYGIIDYAIATDPVATSPLTMRGSVTMPERVEYDIEIRDDGTQAFTNVRSSESMTDFAFERFKRSLLVRYDDEGMTFMNIRLATPEWTIVSDAADAVTFYPKSVAPQPTPTNTLNADIDSLINKYNANIDAGDYESTYSLFAHGQLSSACEGLPDGNQWCAIIRQRQKSWAGAMQNLLNVAAGTGKNYLLGAAVAAWFLRTLVAMASAIVLALAEPARKRLEEVNDAREERRGYAGLDVDKLLPEPPRPGRRAASPARRRPTDATGGMVDSVIDTYLTTRAA